MKIFLPTLPVFLRTNFPKVRGELEGKAFHEFSVNHQVAKKSNVTIFTAGEQQSGNGEFSDSLAAFTENLKRRIRSLRVAKENQQSPILDTTEQLSPNVHYQSKMSTNFFKRVIATALTVITLGSVLVGVFLFVPAAYYAFFPADVIEVEAPEEGTAFGGNFQEAEEEVVEEKYVPPVDPTLPEGDWLIIPRIGVRTQLRDTQDPEEALAEGVWWVPDFGVPGDEELPMIAAAHRYGWKWWWKDDYWKYHSFYLLPDTEPGDRIEVISGQRKWEYEIYAGEEGDEITDYTADLILYTCKFLSGPVRHFRYARLIDPTVNTQQVGVAN